MNKAKFWVISLLLITTNLLSAQTKADEYMAISETLSYYLDGGTYNDFSRLSKAFHKEATMKHVGDEYKSVNALQFFGERMKPGPKSDRKTTIVSINFNDKAANAVLQLEFSDAIIWDFMNLLKIDGQWQIVSKIFSREAKDEEGNTTPTLSQAEKEVLSVLHRWRMAYINKDAEAVANILADNWSYSGQSNVKKETVTGIKTSQADWLAVNFKNLTTRQLDDVIIVSGEETLKIRVAGKINTNRLMFTDVFQKMDGRWQAISTHSSEIKE